MSRLFVSVRGSWPVTGLLFLGLCVACSGEQSDDSALRADPNDGALDAGDAPGGDGDARASDAGNVSMDAGRSREDAGTRDAASGEADAGHTMDGGITSSDGGAGDAGTPLHDASVVTPGGDGGSPTTFGNPAVGTVACGTASTACTDTCCVRHTGGDGEPVQITMTSCADVACEFDVNQCDGAEDCGADQVCCVSSNAGPVGYCASSCGLGDAQACHTKADCAGVGANAMCTSNAGLGTGLCVSLVGA